MIKRIKGRLRRFLRGKSFGDEQKLRRRLLKEIHLDHPSNNQVKMYLEKKRLERIKQC